MKKQYPKAFQHKIDFSKVNTSIIKSWISDELKRIMEFEDEVVINMVSNFVDQQEKDPKFIMDQLSGFLDEKAYSFMKELWKLCITAQSSPNGIPPQLVSKYLPPQEIKYERKMEQIKREEEQDYKTSTDGRDERRRKRHYPSDSDSSVEDRHYRRHHHSRDNSSRSSDRDRHHHRSSSRYDRYYSSRESRESRDYKYSSNSRSSRRRSRSRSYSPY